MHDRCRHSPRYQCQTPIDQDQAARLATLAFSDPHAEITPEIIETVDEILKEMDELDRQEYDGRTTRGVHHDTPGMDET